jgi:uncharacterized protein with HEPN domain
LDLTKNENVARYKNDRVFRGSVERELQIIGEAMLQLKALSPETAAGFTEHDRIIGFRHVLVHGYYDLDADLVWFVIREKLPLLGKELEAALRTDSS